MFYENYLSRLKGNVLSINSAIRGGVILSRLEYFDYLFKKELMIVEGLRNKRNFIDRIVNNSSSCDYRIACFYAQGLSDIMRVVENGYSVQGLKNQFKTMVRVAHSKYICSKNIKVLVSDINGKIHVEVPSVGESCVISNMEDYIAFSIFLLSLLGSYDERDNGFKEWFGTYLAKEFYKIIHNVAPVPFVERETVAKDLKSFISIKRKKVVVPRNKDNVVQLNNGVI